MDGQGSYFARSMGEQGNCPMKLQFQMLAAYNHWVNRRLYAAAAALPERTIVPIAAHSSARYTGR
jgi:hypothetical protein